ncbi:hypothetical protein [Sulfolobus ellipsoid virus 1]|uniref:Uncharacterized protein n=1 Tax=Sulfolobus ellipsoid virus 1 TaxID=2056194 RepID=A0A2H4RBP3_9VIRU|nr:hypothetical protein FGG62_gp09 [Sulfolobus ellipsoid virus 1]ATY46487.1 hypothetical protein [Sulfolobus ellipsoid virus 1]
MINEKILEESLPKVLKDKDTIKLMIKIGEFDATEEDLKRLAEIASDLWDSIYIPKYDVEVLFYPLIKKENGKAVLYQVLKFIEPSLEG